MACAPHQPNLDTGTTTCSNHRGSCSTNRPISWTASEGAAITAANIEEARSDIRDEVARWNLHSDWDMTLYEPNAITAGSTIDNDTINNLDLMVGQMYGSYLSDESDGSVIGDDEWSALLSRYNTVRDNCICNSDCSCNAICTCYGDCGCNYSDERLKDEIVEI